MTGVQTCALPIFVELYNSPEKLEKFSVNGKKIVNKYYSKAAFIEHYRKIYDEMGG